MTMRNKLVALAVLYLFGGTLSTYAGDFEVTVHNVSGWGSIGTNGLVKLYDSADVLVTSQSTDGNGVVMFSGVTAGSGYYYTVHCVPTDPGKIFGQEYWGRSVDVSIGSGDTTYSTFNRNMPYTSNILVQIKSTGEHVRGDSVTPGTPLQISLGVTNPNFPGGGTQNVKGRLVIDRNQAAPYEFDMTSGSQSLAPATDYYYEYDYTPTGTGDYYHVAGAICDVGGSDLYTEGGRWDVDPLFFVRTVPTPPDPPTLLSPANGATGISPSATLTWNASAGATSYRLQLSAEADFDPLVYDASGITTTSHYAQWLSGATTHYWRVFASNAQGTSGPSSAWTFTTWSGPYSGSPAAIPGTIEVEWYDGGGEGITYHDADPQNEGWACRNAEGVDIETCSDPSGGSFNIAWAENGEWMQYSVNVAQTGAYEMEVRVAMGGTTGGRFHVEIDQTDVSGPIIVPTTGGWQTWVSIRDTFNIPGGAHSLRLVMDEMGAPYYVGNFNYLKFSGVSHVNVTVGTDPDSLSYTVDGSPYSVNRQFSWVPGSLHTVGTVSPQPGSTGTQYVWTNWSDGGAISHQIHAAPSAVHTANFRTEHYLTMSADTGGGVTPSSGWYTDGAPVSITAMPDSGYFFTGWEGTGPGSYTGGVNPASINVNGPVSQRATFDPMLPLPGQVVLSLPVDGARVGPASVMTQWHAGGPAVSKYWFEIATDSLFAFAVLDSGVTDTTHEVTGLAIGTRYWWRVKAYNSAGWGPFSQTWTFTTLSLPGQVVLLSPAHDSAIGTDSTLAMWRADSPADDRYWCEIATDSMFNFSNVDSLATDTTFTFRQLTAGTYWWRVKAHNAAGWGPFSEAWKFRVIIISVSETPDLPREFSLSQNYPNPFNPSTSIRFDLPEALFVELKVYNSLGEEVTTLVSAVMPVGRQEVVWNPSNLPSGVYLYRIKAGNHVAARKMVLMK
jgi:hypothetical protein